MTHAVFDCFYCFQGSLFLYFVAKISNAFENVYVLVLILNAALNICYSFVTDCPQGICPQYIQRPTLSINSHNSRFLEATFTMTHLCASVFIM